MCIRDSTPFGREHAKGRAVADLKEFWHVGRVLPSMHPASLSGDVPQNVFPQELPAFALTFNALFDALEGAGITNATVLLSDVAGAVLTETFDVVVANPPFHIGKQTDLDVPRQFIIDAFTVLEPGGHLLLVANRTLPYEAMMSEQFGAYRSLYDGRRFKVLSAIKPG